MIIKSEKIGSQLKFHIDSGDYGIYDFKDASCYKYNVSSGKTNKIKNLNKIFSTIDFNSILNTFEDLKYKKFLNYISKREKLCSNMGTFISRIPKYSLYENYFLQEIEVGANLTQQLSFYTKDIIKILKERNIVVNYNFERTFNIDYNIFKNTLIYANTKDEDIFNSIMELLYYSPNKTNASSYINLINNFNYEYKTLIDYLFDYLPNREGMKGNITIGTLYDYVNMISVMRNKFEKYPKFLHTVHDITSKNYNISKKEYDELKFGKMVNKNLETEIKDFIFIVPKCTNDLVDEGCQLNHCVGSYAKYIIEGKKQIVFMRHKDSINQSLITIDITNNEIIQTEGNLRRIPNEQEKEILKKYAEKMNLIYY